MPRKMLTKEERKASEQFNKVIVRLNSKKEWELLERRQNCTENVRVGIYLTTEQYLAVW